MDANILQINDAALLYFNKETEQIYGRRFGNSLVVLLVMRTKEDVDISNEQCDIKKQ